MTSTELTKRILPYFVYKEFSGGNPDDEVLHNLVAGFTTEKLAQDFIKQLPTNKYTKYVIAYQDKNSERNGGTAPYKP